MTVAATALPRDQGCPHLMQYRIALAVLGHEHCNF